MSFAGHFILCGCELVLGTLGIGVSLHKIGGDVFPRWRLWLLWMPLLLVSGAAITHGTYYALEG